jgi:uncharacterized protein RhaS with RHS repeats
MYYYLYRFYDPNLQRWINRDPVHEAGGRNLYAFVANRPTSRIDLFGLSGPSASLGEQLDCVQACGAKKARKGAKLAKEAIAETRKRFPHAKGEDDYADAFRHCYWACRMARDLGGECAEKILDIHENVGDKGGQNPASGDMDRYNNSAGLNISEEKGDCGTLCDKAMRDGTLVTKPSDLNK